ncbi:MAG TPA: hypothetical protein VJT13_01915 [Xanthobacteraceae bacterium]|jgi:hypothetical protein|nr:hypothetical protein [Xanthobacteraceae bacterium]
MADSWLEAALPLDRPEYSKQTEALLTDLLWRSEGSTLSEVATQLAGLETTTKQKLERVVFEKIGKASPAVLESIPFAREADISSIVAGPRAKECLAALLFGLRAPRSRAYKSLSAVPVHPELVALQTLHGIVNKENPANLAKIIERFGLLGGSDGVGAVARQFLAGFEAQPTAQRGLAGAAGAIYTSISSAVWEQLRTLAAASGKPLPEWPTVRPRQHEAAVTFPHVAALPRTPFKWFWAKWVILCDRERGWLDHLPERRWVDWSLALLRGALAFGYLWEAEWYVRIYDRLVERRRGLEQGPEREKLLGLLNGQFTLAVVHPRQLAPSQKRMWSALADNVARGYEVRRRLIAFFVNNPTNQPQDGDPRTTVPEWIDALSIEDLATLGDSLSITASTATNTKEFIRYLMLQRSADDDSSDQADLYYLARSQQSHFWVELGPEWLVVETALLAGRPGKSCTLRMLMDDLSSLGILIDRSTLVGLLEDTGLSADSPDADDALVIESGF